MSNPLAIIGLDSGITSAYVVLGLDGTVIKTHSAKNFPLSEIISQVIAVCQPLVVSTDKAKVPSLVEEFSRKMGTMIVHPDQDLPREEKKRLVDSTGYYEKSHHVQDSLASACFAYRKYLPRLLKINRYIEEHRLEEIQEEFTRIALKEELNFHLIRSILLAPALENVIMKEVVQENKITKRNFLALHEKLVQVQSEKAAVEKNLQALQQQLQQEKKISSYLKRKTSNVSRQIDTLFQFKENRLQLQQSEMGKKENYIRILQQQITSLYSFIEQSPRQQLVKKLANLGQQEFEERKAILNVQPNDLLLVTDTHIYSEKVLQRLQGKGIVILSPQKLNPVVHQLFLSGLLTEELVPENDYFALITSKVLKKILSQRELVQNIVAEYQQRRTAAL